MRMRESKSVREGERQEETVIKKDGVREEHKREREGENNGRFTLLHRKYFSLRAFVRCTHKAGCPQSTGFIAKASFEKISFGQKIESFFDELITIVSHLI